MPTTDYDQGVELLIERLGGASSQSFDFLREYGNTMAPFTRSVLSQMHADLTAMVLFAKSLRDTGG